MKISNGKKQLAKIIHENGGWRDGAEFAAQGGNHGHVGFASVAPVRNGKVWDMTRGFAGKFLADEILPNWHQTILSRDEYFHLYPAPGAEGWVEWNGGSKSPVAKGDAVDVKIKDGSEHFDQLLDDDCWCDSWGEESIIAYRLHKPEQATAKGRLSGEAVSAAKNALMGDSIEELARKPTIEQLAADYRNAKDYADRKQQEADAAKADAEAKLAELVAAGEALGLVLSVAATEPELVITDWRDLQIGDVIWWCGAKDNAPGEYEVKQLEPDDYDGFLTIAAGNYWVHYEKDDWKFVRRPTKGA